MDELRRLMLQLIPIGMRRYERRSPPVAIISFTQCLRTIVGAKFALYSPISLRLESAAIPFRLLVAFSWRHIATSLFFFHHTSYGRGNPIFARKVVFSAIQFYFFFFYCCLLRHYYYYFFFSLFFSSTLS